MLFETKKLKAKELGIEFPEDISEDALTELMKQAKDAAKAKAVVPVEESNVILKDVDGNNVPQVDYFYPSETSENTAPKYFNKVCGSPVTREELLKVFNNIFDKTKKFLFYKQDDKEVYLVIIPRRYAKTIGRANESAPGDFQKHAISFLHEGSVNLETLKSKLTKIATHNDVSKEPLQY